MNSILQLLQLDPDNYEAHPLHRLERDWTETNCWQDMMIELLHVLGLDPIAPAAFTLSTDSEGNQWTLFKYPPEDLRTLYGMEIAELYVWRPVIDHLEMSLEQGKLLTVEVDSFYLPDTAGVTYQIDHTKTGIVPQMLDRAGRQGDDLVAGGAPYGVARRIGIIGRPFPAGALPEHAAQPQEDEHCERQENDGVKVEHVLHALGSR